MKTIEVKMNERDFKNLAKGKNKLTLEELKKQIAAQRLRNALLKSTRLSMKHGVDKTSDKEIEIAIRNIRNEKRMLDRKAS